MNGIPQFDPERGGVFRAAFVDIVETTARRRLRTRRPLWLGIAAFALAGVVTGGAISAAAATFGDAPVDPAAGPGGEPSVTRTAGAIPAPPGVTPGQPIISLLGNTASQNVDGSTTIALPAHPVGATHLRVTFVCLTPGMTTWGTDPSGNNPGGNCSAADLGTRGDTAYYDFPLTGATSTLTIRANAGVESLITYQFVRHVQTALGVNAKGETFGSGGSGDSPDLVAVTGRNSAGHPVDGYARASDLDAFGPDWAHQPSSPEQALRWQKERDERYPNGWDVPLWKSDGVTRIGTFHLG